MSGEKSITTLLRGMSPILNDGDYVFCSVKDAEVLQGVDVLGTFREKKALLQSSSADELTHLTLSSLRSVRIMPP